MQSQQEPAEQFPSAVSQGQVICPVCGSFMYPTNRSNFEITFRCSSSDARFWEFDRGTKEQAVAKEHWDLSLREIFLNRG
jgi:Zn-finger nucleic acid-binding protein